MTIEDDYKELSKRYKLYSHYDYAFTMLVVLCVLEYIYWLGSQWTPSFIFTIIVSLFLAYVILVLRRSHSLSNREKLFLYTYSSYDRLNNYLKRQDNDERKETVKNLEQMIERMKDTLPNIPNFSREFEERLFPVVKQDDTKNMNQALTILENFIPFTHMDAQIIYSQDKSENLRQELLKLPRHKKIPLTPRIIAKIKTMDGVLFIAVFTIPLIIGVISFYYFDYTEKEAFGTSVNAFIALMVGFVIRIIPSQIAKRKAS